MRLWKPFLAVILAKVLAENPAEITVDPEDIHNFPNELPPDLADQLYTKAQDALSKLAPLSAPQFTVDDHLYTEHDSNQLATEKYLGQVYSQLKRIILYQSPPSPVLSEYDFPALPDTLRNAQIPIIDDKDSLSLVTRKNKAIFMLYLAAYKLDHQPSLNLLGDVFLFGKYFQKRNVTVAFEHYSQLALHGNSLGQRMVGLLYASGIGTPRSYPKSLLYLSFSAIDGDIFASQALAYWNLVGISTSRNCEDAVWHYKRAGALVLKTYDSGPALGKSLSYPNAKSLSETTGGVFGPGASGSGDPKKLKVNEPSAMTAVDILQFYEYSADRGDATAQMLLGKLYYDGSDTISRDFARAFIYFRKCAEQYPLTAKDRTKEDESKLNAAGSAAYYIGKMYLRGEGVSVDEATALQWFQQGIDWGNAASANALGVMHEKGLGGLPKNSIKAQDFFNRAVKAGNAAAHENLGEIYYEKRDYMNALKLFTVGARSYSNLLSLYRLGELNSLGYGTPKSCHTGAGLYKLMIERGDWHMSWIRDAQAAFEKRDYEGAMLGYLLAAELGYEVAQMNAAWMIDYGYFQAENSLFEKGTDPYAIALNLWNRAANQENADARVKVGDHHYYGLGIVEHEKQEDESNHSSMLHQTSSFSSISRTIEFMMKGLGFSHFFEHGSPNYEKAAAYYQVASEQQASSVAMWNLGWMHEHGLGVQKDYHLAKRSYDMCLSTNPAGFLPVNLALIKLGIKFSLQALTRGDFFGMFQASTDPVEFKPKLPPLPQTEEKVEDDGLLTWTKGETFENLLILALCLVAAWLAFQRFQ